jgi:hypothetical protein
MPTEILAPTTAAGASSDVVVADGSTKTVSLYTSLDDNLLLPDGPPTWNGNFLLPDGSSLLLLPSQVGDVVGPSEFFEITYKDPLAVYNPSGMFLRGTEPFKTLGPGTWQVKKPVTQALVGLQYN